MNIYQQLRTNADHEVNGIWIDYGDFKIKIARAGGANKKYLRELESLSRPYRRAIQTGMLPIEKQEEISRLVLAKAVVLDWEGVKGENNEPIEFTQDNVLKVMTDLPEFANEIAAMASKAENFRDNDLEQDSKNS